METNPWQRLSRLAYDRMDYLGLTQTEVERLGGPSSAWVRKLKATTGRPSGRMKKSLRALSTALGWDEDAAWFNLTEDFDQWDADALKGYEHELVTGKSPRAMAAKPESLVTQIKDLLRSDAMATLSEGEWEELLAAVEARQPKRAKTRGRKVSGQ